MKYLILLLISLLVLVSCSNKTSNEVKKQESVSTEDVDKEINNPFFTMSLEKFVDEYNSNIDILIDNDNDVVPSHIDLNKIGDFQKEENNSYIKKIVKENDKNKEQNYDITAWYNQDKKLYQLTLVTMSIDDNFSEKGIASSIVLLRTLGLDGSKINEFFKGDDDEITYQEGGYNVSLKMISDMGVLMVSVKVK
ncbi:hypothetical protein [Metabacillus fastidiosus]|uniref:hypothetical protein n=1 Tax=Metabacillus fastidiosus TaxID=1458 RepID=UPI003D2E6777